MRGFSKAIITGNLTRDPELRSLSSGTSVCTFSVAVNRTYRGNDGQNKEEVSYIDCTAWGKLGETIAHYNEACEAVDDDYFGKDPQFLMPFENGPFYAIHPTYEALVTCGSVKTNNRFQAVDKDNNAIEGLYVIGVEGTMLWANTYTMEVAGSCNANNVNSGRRAAQYALAELKA